MAPQLPSIDSAPSTIPEIIALYVVLKPPRHHRPSSRALYLPRAVASAISSSCRAVNGSHNGKPAVLNLTSSHARAVNGRKAKSPCPQSSEGSHIHLLSRRQWKPDLQTRRPRNVDGRSTTFSRTSPFSVTIPAPALYMEGNSAGGVERNHCSQTGLRPRSALSAALAPVVRVPAPLSAVKDAILAVASVIRAPTRRQPSAIPFTRCAPSVPLHRRPPQTTCFVAHLGPQIRATTARRSSSSSRRPCRRPLPNAAALSPTMSPCSAP